MSLAYHLAELKIAQNPDDPAHILPPPVPANARVLDVGCGAGQSLIAAYPGRVSYGVDIDLSALALGATITDHVRFTCARGETLPYADGRFDLVFSRVALPYMNVPTALREIRRVLAPGGVFWATLHPFSLCWRQARKTATLRGWLYLAYIVANSLWLHFVGAEFAALGRCETFQTCRGIARALDRAGFSDIRVVRGRHLVVTATAPPQSPRAR
jgi:SAM-dependent methyltransferase